MAAHGLRSVTMSQIAEETGIARATLYKYFADVEAMLVAWHERRIAAHLERLDQVACGSGAAIERLEAVLETYALIQHEHRLVRTLLAEAASAGAVRADVAPGELARYCLHALAAAASLPSKAALRRLVGVTLDGLRA